MIYIYIYIYPPPESIRGPAGWIVESWQKAWQKLAFSQNKPATSLWQSRTGWWFLIFFHFHPEIWGRWNHFDSYSSDGVETTKQKKLNTQMGTLTDEFQVIEKRPFYTNEPSFVGGVIAHWFPKIAARWLPVGFESWESEGSLSDINSSWSKQMHIDAQCTPVS